MQRKAVCFEKSNVRDLKEKLVELLEDADKVMDYKEHAQEYICKRYSWDDVTERTLKLYKM